MTGLKSAAAHEAELNIDEGLQENGKSLHQIPTYVTAVPNGTEKVCRPDTGLFSQNSDNG